MLLSCCVYTHAQLIYVYVQNASPPNKCNPQFLLVAPQTVCTCAGLQQERQRDAVIDPYRRHFYSLRRTLLLCPTSDTIDDIARGYLEDLVHEIVDGLIDHGEPPASWPLETVLAFVLGIINGDPSPTLSRQRDMFQGRISEGRLDPRHRHYRVAIDLFPPDTVAKLTSALDKNEMMPPPSGDHLTVTRSIVHRVCQDYEARDVYLIDKCDSGPPKLLTDTTSTSL